MAQEKGRLPAPDLQSGPRRAAAKGCPHCPGGFGLKRPLFEDKHFWIVCDAHPLAEGNILIVSKEHIPCMGALDEGRFARFRELYERVLAFLNRAYGKVAAFEHGVAGQTVFHAHMHLLPFGKSVKEIAPGKESVRKISKLDEIRAEFNKRGKYLYLAISDRKWLLDTGLGQPGFFRERFARALGAGERGNWKEARGSRELMKIFERDIRNLEGRWAREGSRYLNLIN